MDRHSRVKSHRRFALKERQRFCDRLQEGDVTEQRFRNMIIREIDDIKSKVDGLARKDLLTSISIFKEGIVFLYKVLDMKYSTKKGRATEQGTVTEGSREATSQLSLRSLETDVKVSLARDMESLDEARKRALADAKKRFDEARLKATEAFNNVALSTTDRILAMQYRVMSTILEKIDNPKEAIAACKLCLEELHSMRAVNKSFKVENAGGFLSCFNKEEREQIIQSVRDVNRVIFRITAVSDGILSEELEAWPRVNIEGKEVNPLSIQGDNIFHSRVLPWTFGQEGEEEHKLTRPQSITTNSLGQFIVADDNNIKVFDSSGKFLFSFCPGAVLKDIKDVATDQGDNVFVLTISSEVIVFDKEGHMLRSFCLLPGSEGISIAVNENQKVFLLLKHFLPISNKPKNIVAVCDVTGQDMTIFSIAPFGTKPTYMYITSASDNRVMVLGNDVHYFIQIFDEKGHLLDDFPCLVSSVLPISVIAFHLSTEHILIPSRNSDGALNIEIRTKYGEPVRNLYKETDNICSVSGIAVTTNGRIVVLCTTQGIERNGEQHLVLVE